MNDKPLNVAFRSDEEIGRWMSNFTKTPFALDGVEYASIEGFYNMLKYLDAAKRAKIAAMWGVRAKNLGKRSKLVTTCYRGEWFDFGTETHFALVKRALRAKLAAYPEMARLYVATRPRPIIHDTGYPHTGGGEFPHAVFVRLLAELREEFAAAQGS